MIQVKANFRSLFVGTVELLSPLTQQVHRTAPALDEPIFTPEVTIDRALETARHAAGGAEVDSLSILPSNGLYWVRLFDPRDLANYGQRYIYVSMRDGAVVGDRHRARGSAGDVIVALQLPLHSGKILGWPGRILISITGLVICGVVVTGFVLWFRKRRGRLALASRSKAGRES